MVYINSYRVYPHLDFANYWLKQFSSKMMMIQLNILKQKQDGLYVAPRVLQQILNYIETAVGHAHTWRILKDVYSDMLEIILFPLLCFSDDDQDLWDDDPHEFIRSKFDVFEDFISPNTAAQTVLYPCLLYRFPNLPPGAAYGVFET